MICDELDRHVKECDFGKN
jgi:hypothetical protein